MWNSIHVDPKNNLFGLEPAPIFTPTEEEFKDPYKYIHSISSIGEKYGICKIIPPPSWKPPFCLDQEKFKFRSRIQKLNSLEAQTRIHTYYAEALEIFWETQGKPMSKHPSISKKPIDLYALKLEVAKRGGPQKVTDLKLWSAVATTLGFSRQDAASASSTMKQIYFKYIVPFEQYLAENKSLTSSKQDEKSNSPGKYRSTSNSTPNPKTDSDSNLNSNSNSSTNLNLNSNSNSSSNLQASDVSELLAPLMSKIKDSLDSNSNSNPNVNANTNESATAPMEHNDEICELCLSGDDAEKMLLCDECDRGFHMHCLVPPLMQVPEGDWYCPECLARPNEVGFEEGKVYNLRTFKEMADRFKRTHFQEKLPGQKPTEADVEREYWDLVGSPFQSIKVEYGADIHTNKHGSGFPSFELHPTNYYSTCPWNLNNLSILPDSVFSYIKADISGMMKPWVYIGMCLSTFCWHNEDHYTASINYLHWGDTKTWYGVSGHEAEKFEKALKKIVPDVFEEQPDILYHLATTMSPAKLKAHGVNLHCVHQHEGEFVITFPQAYHAGFNHGYNCAEAVNFATIDWFKYGKKCVQRYREYKKGPCFSHEELLFTILKNESNITLAIHLLKELEDVCHEEFELRKSIREKYIPFEMTDDFDQEDSCFYCNSLCYFSLLYSKQTKQIACLHHLEELGDISKIVLKERVREDDMHEVLEETRRITNAPKEWVQKLQSTLLASRKPSLKQLQQLLLESEKIPVPIEEAQFLSHFIDQANDWIDRASRICSRKQKKRRLNDSSSEIKPTVEEIGQLLKEYETLPFGAPESYNLTLLLNGIKSFQEKVQPVMNLPFSPNMIDELKALLELGQSLEVEIAELDQLEKKFYTFVFLEKVKKTDLQHVDFPVVQELVEESIKLDISPLNKVYLDLINMYREAEKWNNEASIMIGDNSAPSLSELKELYESSDSKPVSQNLLYSVMKHVNAAQSWLESYEKLWKKDDLNQEKVINSDSAQNLDSTNESPQLILVNEVSLLNGEKWTRLLRRLSDSSKTMLVHFPLEFEKVNTTLSRIEHWLAKCHAILAKDKGNTERLLEILWRSAVIAAYDYAPEIVPDNGEFNLKDPIPIDVYCYCSQSESGLMIQCEACEEWFHGKCVAVGKKSADANLKYICPFCDLKKPFHYETKRPKIETLLELCHEGENLPVILREVKLLQAITQNVEIYYQKVINYIENSNDLKLVQKLIQHGRALEVDTQMVEKLTLKVQDIHIQDWKIRLQDTLSSKGEKITILTELLKEGEMYTGVDDEIVHIKNVIISQKSMQWKKRLVELLENSTTDVSILPTLQEMLITSQNLIVEPEYVEALNERIEILEQPDSNDQVSVQVPLSVVYPDSVVIEEDQTKVYCVCRESYDENKPMIGCDFCQEWYHLECVEISVSKANKLKKYLCPPCKKKRKENNHKHSQDLENRTKSKKNGKKKDNTADDDEEKEKEKKRRRREKRKEKERLRNLVGDENGKVKKIRNDKKLKGEKLYNYQNENGESNHHKKLKDSKIDSSTNIQLIDWISD